MTNLQHPTPEEHITLMRMYGEYYFTVVGMAGNPLVSMQNKGRVQTHLQDEIDRLTMRLAEATAARDAIRDDRLHLPNDADTPVEPITDEGEENWSSLPGNYDERGIR